MPDDVEGMGKEYAQHRLSLAAGKIWCWLGDPDFRLLTLQGGSER